MANHQERTGGRGRTESLEGGEKWGGKWWKREKKKREGKDEDGGEEKRLEEGEEKVKRRKSKKNRGRKKRRNGQERTREVKARREKEDQFFPHANEKRRMRSVNNANALPSLAFLRLHWTALIERSFNLFHRLLSAYSHGKLAIIGA